MSIIKVTPAEINYIKSLIPPLVSGQIPPNVRIDLLRAITKRRRYDRQITKQDVRCIKLLEGAATFFEDFTNGRSFTDIQIGRMSVFLEIIVEFLPKQEEFRVDLFGDPVAMPTTLAKEPAAPEATEDMDILERIQLAETIPLEDACQELIRAGHRGNFDQMSLSAMKAILALDFKLWQEGPLGGLRSVLFRWTMGKAVDGKAMKSDAQKCTIARSLYEAGMPSAADIAKREAELAADPDA